MKKAFLYRYLRSIENKGIISLCVLGSYCSANGQDLEPRAYVRVPINANIILPGFNHSHGEVLTDPSVPLRDFKANVETFTLGYAHTFSLFGRTAQAFAVLPFCLAHASALVSGQFQAVDRSGLADIRARLSVLLIGGPALTLREFVKQKKPHTVLGTS